jgi:transcriptional regulator with XRE-family HTH domain
MATVRTVRKLMLGREIEHMMKTAGKSPADLADILGTSRSRVGQLLSGQGLVSVGDLERLANQLGFPDADYHAALFALRKDNHKRGFWNTGYRRAYTHELRLRVDIEMHADRIREFEVEVVPGLLQCPDYVRAFYAGMPETEGLTLDDEVKARVARQDIFGKENPPNVHFVLSESCLRRVWCDGPTMAAQLEYMIALSQRENVMIQVLPFARPVGRRTPIGNRFTLLRIPAVGVAGPLELAYTEGRGEIRYLDDVDALTAYDNAWTRLSTASLTFDETRSFLHEMIKECR